MIQSLKEQMSGVNWVVVIVVAALWTAILYSPISDINFLSCLH